MHLGCVGEQNAQYIWKTSLAHDLGFRGSQPLSSCTGNFRWRWSDSQEVVLISYPPPAWEYVRRHKHDAKLTVSVTTRWSPPTRPTTTTSATLTCRISSMSGCGSPTKPVFPDLFATLAVPKAEELVATPYRHGNKKKAESLFLGRNDGQAMRVLPNRHTPASRSPSTTPSSSPRRKGTTGHFQHRLGDLPGCRDRGSASRSPALGRCAPN